MRGDAACLQCHADFARDLEAHTHHAPESDGSRCQNCHMPYTTYALLKAIRQHQIDVPTVAASVATGRPNACNACHLDREPRLGARRRWPSWYGQPEPALDDEQQRVAASVLWMLTGDAAQRALVAWYAGWEPARRAAGGDWLAPHLAQLLDDPYPAVRYLAWRSLRSAEGFGDLDYDYVGPRAGARRGARRGLAALERAGAAARRARARAAARAGRRARPRGLRRSCLSRRDDRAVYVAE